MKANCRKRTKSGGKFNENEEEGKVSVTTFEEVYGSNYKELKIYLGMCLFSSLFYFIIIQINNSLNLTSLLNLNQLACKTSVFDFQIKDVFDELNISMTRLFSSRQELESVKNSIFQSNSKNSSPMEDNTYLHSIYVLKWIVQSFSLFLLWHCFIKKRIDITNVGTYCDFLKEIIFFITIAELLQIWFPMIWLGIIYFPVKGSYIFWTDFAWQIKNGDKYSKPRLDAKNTVKLRQ